MGDAGTRSPLPSLADAVGHVRERIRATCSDPLVAMFGWADATPGATVAELVVILDALAAAYPNGSPNLWKVNGGEFAWIGPEIGRIHHDGIEWVVTAGGHLDPGEFHRVTRWMAEDQGCTGWLETVNAHGVQHVYLRKTETGLAFTDFDDGPDLIEVTACPREPTTKRLADAVVVFEP